jgi:hypothetical protein
MKQFFLFMMIFKKNKTKKKKILQGNSTRKFYNEILRDLVLFFIFNLFYINLKDVLFSK